MNNKIKIVIVVFFILCFLLFLHYRRKKLQENFECVKIDNSLFCPEDSNDIDRFRLDQDQYYKKEVEDKDFYRYLKSFSGDSRLVSGPSKFNYIQSNKNDDKFKLFNNLKPYDSVRFDTVFRLLKPEITDFYHKYDFINCENTEIDQRDLMEGADGESTISIMTPSGVLFDKYTDDIIVFDAYRLRRYSYRDLRIKYNVQSGSLSDYYPVLDSMPIEIETTDDFYRKELIKLCFALFQIKDEINVLLYDISYQDYTQKNDKFLLEDLKSIKNNLDTDENITKKIKIIYKDGINDDVEVEKTGLEFKSRLEFLEENLLRTNKFKDCVKEVKTINKDEKICRIKYQKDLPSFDMGPIEGKGVESMQYDDDRPPTIIHSTYLDTRMSPWANSWNNIKSEGVFSPLIVSRANRMKIFNKSGNLKFNDGLKYALDNKTGERGNIVGIRQKSMSINPEERTHLYNESILDPLAHTSEEILDVKLSETADKHNFVLEHFSSDEKKNIYENTEKDEPTKKKINYGYPSFKLHREMDDSIGVFNIPDEIDSTGIGMDIVDTESEQIILVPDVYNNRIQVFKKDKSELIFFGQFGNLPFTSSRSLPTFNNQENRFEPIHNTEDERFISEPGCESTCKFDMEDNYSGYKRTNATGKECKPWIDYKDREKKIPFQQINNEFKKEPFKQQEFIEKIRKDLDEEKRLDNKCISLNESNKEPVCIVNQEGQDILSKCFNDYENEGNRISVTNKDSCDGWLKDYTDRFGPIDANFCLGDNEQRQLTAEEIKSGKVGKKDCIFECDARFSYRRANIHQRQEVYKSFGENEERVFRKRGHFFSLLDEFERCKTGIQTEKETGKKVFEDSEFINPHFLGVDSQACVGKKKDDGNCDFKDPRMTNGVNNCSLGYRKYLLKMINITNQGQKFGQLFHPKSIAFDNVDKKYYVVDCYHHCVQCFELIEGEKTVTESGDKLKFESADKDFNKTNMFYYDDNFKTTNALKYNRSKVYSLGLRQNLIYEEAFDKFSRVGEVSDDVYSYLEDIVEMKVRISEIQTLINEEIPKVKRDIFLDRDILKSTKDNSEKSSLNNKIRKETSNILTKARTAKSHLRSMPESVINESEKKELMEEIDYSTEDFDTLDAYIIEQDGDMEYNLASDATAPDSAQNKKFSKEKGYSMISENWAKKYSDVKIRLSRWVSGISEWGNHIYAGFEKNVDYKKINALGDYYFNSIKGGSGESPGCGEFSYPSDIAISMNSCLGQGVQVMMVTDTGNNRVSVFKKYNLDGNMRFRFYCFLGDEESVENKTLINPISVCISEVSGNVFVLEANFYDHVMNYSNPNELEKPKTQRIKVFYPDIEKKNYFWSHNIEIDKYIDDRDAILNNISKKDKNGKIEPRITKIRIDDRGILALTDINNNRVHLLKESIVGDFEIANIDDSALNKVTVDIDYDPYKNFKSYDDKKIIPIINNDRLRFIFQRQRVCAFQNGDVILSKEFKTGNMPFGDYQKKFHIEDVRQVEEFDNCWVSHTDTGVKFNDTDNIITNDTGKKLRIETNRPNFEINKKYAPDGSLNFYEDWRGRTLEPNSSYYYKIFVYNYHFIKSTESIIDKIVQTYPEYLSDGDIIPKNIANEKENYINLGINYGYDSKKYNPICFTILRRIHNRTKDVVTKNINCNKNSKIQLFLPSKSKIIFQEKSRPKLGRLLCYDIEKGGEFETNLFEIERGVEYSENKYLIFYSCQGGDEKIGGFNLPDAKTAGVETIMDEFILGDRLETVHNQVKYSVSIDITQDNKQPVIFKDNDLVDDNMKFYKKQSMGKNSTDLVKLVKMSYAKKLEDGKYVYPGIVEYCDKGINLGPDDIVPIEMNQTYEYVILVSNPFKVNPAVNSFYYTTRPERPHITSVEFDKQAKINKMTLVSKNNVVDDNPNDNKVTFDGGENPEKLDIAKVTWYYPKNRSLYWPLNFIILRKDISKKPKIIKPKSYDIDFMNVVKPSENDKLFKIQKKSLKLLKNSDPNASGIFRRKYNLGKKIDWRIKIFGTPGIKAKINDLPYDWSESYIEFKSIKFVTIEITLKGQQQITNITCDETVVLEETTGAPSPNVERLEQIKESKLEEEKQENQKIKNAVDDFRKSSSINFIFNLGDDYHGFYSNMANAPKTGYSGSLYRYIKDMQKDRLLDIFDELHNEMKIYSGDVGLRMDGANRTLRSGDKDMIIDKIRHFAFILRQQKKSEHKSMGIDCGDLELDDIKIVSTNEGGIPKIKAIQCNNLESVSIAPSPSSNDSVSTPPTISNNKKELTSEQCSTLPKTGLTGEDKIVITNVRTLGECCDKCQMSNDCEVAEFKESEKKCELHKSYNYNNEIPNVEKSTLLGKTATTFDLPSEEPLAPVESEEVIAPHLSEWEVVKTVYRKNEKIENYSYRYSKMTTEEDRKIIQSQFAFEPTMVSLSGDPNGVLMPPVSSSSQEIEFNSHEASIPLPRGKRFAYKIAVFQTGLSMDTAEKKRFLGVNTNNSVLGLGEVYSNEIEMGESIQQTVIINQPPFMPLPTYKVPEVERPIIKFFEPKEGSDKSIIRVVGLKLDEIEYFSFRDVKVNIMKRQERIIGNVKYQEYLFKPPSVKELERKCWQSIEKYRALVWGYWNGYQIISSEGSNDLTKMFVYNTPGDCKPDDK